jgi:hypothetical protein
MNVIKKLFNKNIYIRLAVILINFQNFWQNIPSWWESLWWWDLGHNLLSQAFWWDCCLRPFSGNPFDGGILGFFEAFGDHEAFSQTFPLLRWNFSYRGAFHKYFFTRWNSGYHEAFHMNFSFSRWNFVYQGAFHTNFSFSRLNSGYHEAFHKIKFTKCTIWGETLFIYIYISQRVFTQDPPH